MISPDTWVLAKCLTSITAYFHPIRSSMLGRINVWTPKRLTHWKTLYSVDGKISHVDPFIQMTCSKALCLISRTNIKKRYVDSITWLSFSNRKIPIPSFAPSLSCRIMYFPSAWQGNRRNGSLAMPCSDDNGSSTGSFFF